MQLFSAVILVVLAVIGLYLLSAFGVTEVNIGDLLVLGCACGFAVQIILVDRLGKQLDGLRLNLVQFLVSTVLSCAATLLVTLACGGASGNLLVAIIICYLIYNGIIEQFILYPAVIGESLGLSTLETIIMVLLGAIFAGIPGMILALPAASAAKYIIPQIYRGLTDRKKQP